MDSKKQWKVASDDDPRNKPKISQASRGNIKTNQSANLNAEHDESGIEVDKDKSLNEAFLDAVPLSGSIFLKAKNEPLNYQI